MSDKSLSPLKPSGAPRGHSAERLWDTYFEHDLRTKLYPTEIISECRKAYLTGVWSAYELLNKVLSSKRLDEKTSIAFLNDLRAELKAKVVPPPKDPIFGGPAV